MQLGFATREFYDFDDWSPSRTIVAAEDTTVTAIWIPTDYLILYNAVNDNLDENTNPETFNVEDELPITLNDPTGEGDTTFVGWFDAEVEGNLVTEITSDDLGDTLELWAYFEPIELEPEPE